MIPLALWLACQGGATPEPEPEPAPDPGLAPLDPPRLLRRASLDLRGVLPSVEELDQVEADPAALEPLLQGYLASPLLEEQLVRLLGDHFLTRLDEFEVRYSDYRLAPEEEYTFLRSVAEEPLRLMARVIVEDRPWPEVVNSQQTVANELLAEIWPLDYPADASGWQWASYTDGRPAVGVLATNGLWWRYVTSPSNKNRSRVAAIARLFLCEDILSRPVTFTGALSIEEDPEAAISTVPACMACHASVEPIAATLFGFYWYTQYSAAEMSRYHPEREPTGTDTLGVEAAWYGEPIAGLRDLGRSLSTDPRFARCAAETAATLLWRRPPSTADFAAVEALREVYFQSEQRMLPVLEAILLSPRYQAGGFTPQATDADLERERTHRLLPPNQLAAAITDLTGFAWTFEGWAQLDNDLHGFRVLAGGVDGYAVTQPQADPGLTWSLVVQRLAEGAADWAVQRELVEGGERRVFATVTLDSRPGDADFTAELEALRWRLHAERADEAWLAEVAALWSASYALDANPALAWTTTLSALLRDPSFVRT